MRLAPLILVFSLSCFAQAPDLSTPKVINLFAGPSTDGHKLGGTLGASYPFTVATSGGLAADLAFRSKALPQTNIRGFFEWQAFKVGSLPVILTEDVGAAFAASDPASAIQKTGALLQSVLSNVGTNVGYLAATGVRTDIPIGRGFVLQPRVRLAKGSLNDTGIVVALTLGSSVVVSK